MSIQWIENIMWLLVIFLVLFFIYSIVRDVRHSRELRKKDEIIGKQFDKLFEFGQDVARVKTAIEEGSNKTHENTINLKESINVNKGLAETINKLLIKKKR